jgi:D-arginine dehydrogenase
MDNFDVIVVGGGICGASIAFELSRDRRVCLLEQEAQLALHATGRSAATFVESYAGLTVSALTMAGRAFFEHPPDSYWPQPPISPLPVLFFTSTRDLVKLREFYETMARQVPALRYLDAAELQRHCPLLRPEYASGGVLEAGSMAIDIHALHQGFVRGIRAHGGQIVTTCGLASARRDAGTWTVVDTVGDRRGAPVLVNAAGAWCDQVATTCGVRPANIVPLRRSAFTISAPARAMTDEVSFVIDLDNAFYIKADAGQLLCSPADETRQPPGDAKPDELEIARALDTINEMTTISTRHVNTAWGGLRSFAPDRLPVVGFDPEVEGFFWYGGQGGYGVQTSPALSRTGAALVRGEDIPADVFARGVRAEQLAADRSALATATF